jgi:hypothetical protein
MSARDVESGSGAEWTLSVQSLPSGNGAFTLVLVAAGSGIVDAVGNPPPGFGGRYFVFVKIRTACGIEGVEGVRAEIGPQRWEHGLAHTPHEHAVVGDEGECEAARRQVRQRGLEAREARDEGLCHGVHPQRPRRAVTKSATRKPAYSPRASLLPSPLHPPPMHTGKLIAWPEIVRPLSIVAGLIIGTASC